MTTSTASSSSLPSSVSSLFSTPVPRVSFPPLLLRGVESILTSAVDAAQAAGQLPTHAWTQIAVSTMASNRAATHYTASVLKNAHAYNTQHGHTAANTNQTTNNKQGKQKKRKKNERGEWVTIKVDDKDDNPASVDASAVVPSVAPSEVSAVGDSLPAAAAAAAPPTAPLADAYEWAVIVGRHFSDLLASSPAGVSLRLQADIQIDVPKPDASIRGGGFIDFAIKAKTNASNTSDAASSVGAVAVPSSSSASPSDLSSIDSATGVVAPLATATHFNFASIGTIDSVFKLKYGTPRQGTIAPSSRGSLTLHPSIPVESLDGIEEYSHLWILFIFHRNENKRFKPKIEPPRAGGKKIGVFATRTPHRLNPIGLSLVKLERVEGRTLHLSSLDLIQGTPVVDIKPYHPADVMPDFTLPQWMVEQAEVKPPFRVVFSADAERDLTQVIPKLEFFKTRQEARDAIEESVSLDPRPIYVRSRASKEEVYGYRLDRLNVLYRVDDEQKLASVCAVQYVDYAALLAEQKEEELANAAGIESSASTKGHKGASRTTTTSAEEEFITKKFLQQRPKREYPMATATPAAATLTTQEAQTESSHMTQPAETATADTAQSSN